jgi:hypothetical protein
VPLTRLRSVVAQVAERLGDKSSIVRRNGLELLIAMIKKNPYADKARALLSSKNLFYYDLHGPLFSSSCSWMMLASRHSYRRHRRL